eukprot:maker-scaffold_4-snap-gene-20.47-mRNA-1 protein AED:0.04 eAED:0.07 QI:0/0/0.5/1/1/1/2/21/440
MGLLYQNAPLTKGLIKKEGKQLLKTKRKRDRKSSSKEKLKPTKKLPTRKDYVSSSPTSSITLKKLATVPMFQVRTKFDVTFKDQLLALQQQRNEFKSQDLSFCEYILSNKKRSRLQCSGQSNTSQTLRNEEYSRKLESSIPNTAILNHNRNKTVVKNIDDYKLVSEKGNPSCIRRKTQCKSQRSHTATAKKAAQDLLKYPLNTREDKSSDSSKLKNFNASTRKTTGVEQRSLQGVLSESSSVPPSIVGNDGKAQTMSEKVMQQRTEADEIEHVNYTDVIPVSEKQLQQVGSTTTIEAQVLSTNSISGKKKTDVKKPPQLCLRKVKMNKAMVQKLCNTHERGGVTIGSKQRVSKKRSWSCISEKSGKVLSMSSNNVNPEHKPSASCPQVTRKLIHKAIQTSEVSDKADSSSENKKEVGLHENYYKDVRLNECLDVYNLSII